MAQMEGGKAVEIFGLVVKNNMLPQKLEKLVPMKFIGDAAVKFYCDAVKHMDEIGMTEDQRKATLQDGQDAGELLLEIESRIGELLPTPTVMKDTAVRSKSGKGERSLPEGMTSKRAFHARAIANHPDVVAKIKQEARANEDIPTRTAVLNRINYEKERKRREVAEGKRKEIKAIIAADQIQYLLALDKCISVLPQKPPKTWNESAFAEAKAKAKIIIRRLEVFNE